MPKIVSRSIACTDNGSDTYGNDESRLFVFECLCGQMCLVSDSNLKRLPLRAKDSSRVLDKKFTVFKLYTVAEYNPSEDLLYIAHRDNDKVVEKQYLRRCPRCRLPIAYMHQEPKQTNHAAPDSVIYFVLSGALVERKNKNQQGGHRSGFKGDYKPRIMSGPGGSGFVTASSMAEEEQENSAREIANSYEENARIIAMQLERKRAAISATSSAKASTSGEGNNTQRGREPEEKRYKAN